MTYYQNIECGNIHKSFKEMMKEAIEMYDIDDTNVLGWREYYKEVIE